MCVFCKLVCICVAYAFSRCFEYGIVQCSFLPSLPQLQNNTRCYAQSLFILPPLTPTPTHTHSRTQPLRTGPLYALTLGLCVMCVCVLCVCVCVCVCACVCVRETVRGGARNMRAI